MINYDIGIESIHIPDNATIILDRKQIRRDYGSIKTFVEVYELNKHNVNSALQEGALWGTINKNRNISQRYIDWERTDWEICSDAVKNAYLLVDLHNKKEVE